MCRSATYYAGFGLCKLSEESRRSAPAPVCLETECVRVAAGIIQAADFSADPCEDFYQVAIHLHLSTLSIPAVSTSSTRAGAGWTPTPSRTASPAGTPSRNSGRIIRTHSGKRH